jgi:hypothetical protein
MTTFGMEFEVQGVSVQKAYRVLNEGGINCEMPDRQHQTSNNWKAVYDGSVSNGAEVVSPILNESRLNEAVAVTKILKTAGARVDRATGFHVHIGLNAFNGSDFTGSICTQLLLNAPRYRLTGCTFTPSQFFLQGAGATRGRGRGRICKRWQNGKP